MKSGLKVKYPISGISLDPRPHNCLFSSSWSEPGHGKLRIQLEIVLQCLGSLDLYTVCLTPSHLRRGAGGARDPTGCVKLQALVYDILLSTTAIFSYAIGSRKLSASNEQFFVDAQTVVSLLQTTQIISDVCFITDHVAYASSNRTEID